MQDVSDSVCKCIKVEYNVFSFLTEENLKDICGFFQYRSYAEDEIIWEEGDHCEYTAIIASGQVELKKQTEFKGRHVIVGLFKSGSILGSICILDDRPRAATAEALEPVELLTLTRKNFENLIHRNPELGIQLMKGMLLSSSLRLRRCFDRLVKFF